MLNIRIRVHWAGGKTQTLGPFWHGREVDRLNVDAVIIHQNVRDLTTFHRILDHHRDDMARVIDMRDAFAIQRRSQLRDLPPLLGALNL